MNTYYIYFMTNKNKTVLYIGVTNDLKRRVYEHSNGLINGFTKKYNCHYIIYWEEFNDIDQAIEREKVLKKWRREKKENLINQVNPNWEFKNEIVLDE